MNQGRIVEGVVIDPGHGGSDMGVVGEDINEKDLNLEVSNYIYYRLNQLGIPTFLTRNSDVDLSEEERIRRIVNAFGDRENVIVISNHIGEEGNGANIMYAFRNSNVLANKIMEELSKAGQIVNTPYQRRLPSDTSKDYYFIHRLTSSVQPLIIEYGNMKDPIDLNRIKNDLLTYGEAVVKAISEYAGITYKPPDDKGNIHVVRKGESLYSIARKYNTTVNEILNLNTLSSNILSVGQILLIPRKSGEDFFSNGTKDIVYTVKEGDNIYRIANMFNSSVDDIIKLNNLESNLLSVGQVLRIPSTNVSIPEKPNDTINQIETQGTYIVKPGDSLYTIANRFGIGVDDIVKVNDLKTNLLSLGQRLIIPTSKVLTNYISYTIKEGDNLYEIARRYNTTVDEIKKASGLVTNALNVGQVIKIPR